MAVWDKRYIAGKLHDDVRGNSTVRQDVGDR
jgi:hypothetical protein